MSFPSLYMDFYATIERNADGVQIIEFHPPLLHEGYQDAIYDNAHDVFEGCPDEPGQYLVEGVYEANYDGDSIRANRYTFVVDAAELGVAS